jgi:hypothetical protein
MPQNRSWEKRRNTKPEVLRYLTAQTVCPAKAKYTSATALPADYYQCRDGYTIPPSCPRATPGVSYRVVSPSILGAAQT